MSYPSSSLDQLGIFFQVNAYKYTSIVDKSYKLQILLV